MLATSFERIKAGIGTKLEFSIPTTVVLEGSFWELFCNKGVLGCVFVSEFKVFRIVEPQL